MQLSWSHKLFLSINSSIGKNPRRDSVMIFSAKMLVFIMLALALGYGIVAWSWGNGGWLRMYINFCIGAFICSEIVSYGFALLFRHPRPRIEFPESKQLIHTVGTWKSFPSDHAIGSFCIAGALLFVPTTPVLMIIFFYFLACLVSFSRVYVGVHYPRDIIGGCILAHGILWSFPWIIAHIIEPIARLW